MVQRRQHCIARRHTVSVCHIIFLFFDDYRETIFGNNFQLCFILQMHYFPHHSYVTGLIPKTPAIELLGNSRNNDNNV